MNKFRIIDVLNESFALNERHKENKAKKDAYIRSRGGRDNAPQGVYSDQEVYADNPHGSDGGMRGKKKTPGAKPSKEQQRLDTQRRMDMRKRRTMTSENFERAYVESHAQIALVLAESLGLISELKSAGEHGASVAPGDRQKAIRLRTKRLKAVTRNQSDAARAAGHRAFYDSRKASETADKAVTAQETASKEQRQKEKGR